MWQHEACRKNNGIICNFEVNSSIIKKGHNINGQEMCSLNDVNVGNGVICKQNYRYPMKQSVDCILTN